MGRGGYRFFFCCILNTVRFDFRYGKARSHEIFESRSGDRENSLLFSPICFPQRSDNESIPRALTFAAPHPVTFTITPLAGSFFASLTGCTLSLNAISPSIWNEISRACESYRCCYCQLAQVVNEQKQGDRSEVEREKEKETEFDVIYLEEGDIVIDRQEIVGGVSYDPFNSIIDALVFVVTSCAESVNARRRTATECTRWYIVMISTVRWQYRQNAYEKMLYHL